MSDMKDMIVESVTKMLENYSTKEIVNDSEKGIWAKELWDSLAENGMLTVAVKEELGGTGGDYIDAFAILQAAGKYAAPIPLAETYIANWLLAESGKQIQEGILTVAYEKEKTVFKLQKDGSGWIVSGKAAKVPWARYAEKVLALSESEEGSCLALIPLDQAEIIHGKNMAGEARDEVIFKDAVVEECAIIPVEKEETAKKLLYMGALTRCVMMAGALEKALETAVNHTKERIQFGRPIHRFQAVQHHISALAGEASAAAIAASYAVEKFQEDPFAKEIAYAKTRINEAVGNANPVAHQVLAAIGFTYEHTLHHSTRRLWSWRDEFGTETEWEQIIADELLQLGKNELWDLITGVKTKEVEVGNR